MIVFNYIIIWVIYIAQRSMEYIQLQKKSINVCWKDVIILSSRRTVHKQLAACFQFPEGYPDKPVLVELKSKVFPEKLLAGLTKVIDEEAKKNAGGPMVSCPITYYGIPGNQGKIPVPISREIRRDSREYLDFNKFYYSCHIHFSCWFLLWET